MKNQVMRALLPSIFSNIAFALRPAVKNVFGALFFILLGLASTVFARDLEVLLVVGASGEAEYGKLFDAQVTVWKEACDKAAVPLKIIGRDELVEDLPKLEAAIKQAVSKSGGQFWLVMIGHGTFDGREAKFNLRGPDLTTKQLGDWLKPLDREFVLIQTASASAGFIQPLVGKNRIIVSATKSSDEVFYTRFGEYFAPAIAGKAEADLDQDKQVSVLEAFLYASKQVAEFYEKEERLATEHPLLEDNGDGVGTRSEIFEGVKATVAKADGARASQVALVLSEEEMKLSDEQRLKRDALETELDALKVRRPEMGEASYYGELEELLRKLAEVYR